MKLQKLGPVGPIFGVREHSSRFSGELEILPVEEFSAK
jgi:hypothetical protein